MVADHQRRAPAMRDRRGDGRPRRVRRSSTSPARARSTTCSAWSSARWTCRSAASCTRRCSTEHGGFVADLTIMRLGARPLPRRHRRLSTGCATRTGSPTTCRPTARSQLHDQTSALCTIGVWGPRGARPRRRRRPRDDVSNAGFPFGDCRGRSSSAASRRWRPASRTSASSAGRSTPRWSKACGCGTRSGRRARSSASSPVGHRRLRDDRPAREGLPPHGAELEREYNLGRGRAWPGRRSRTPTSSARRPTSSSVPSRRPRSCAR